jgi:tetratricopeptide (TPR) repeat protein
MIRPNLRVLPLLAVTVLAPAATVSAQDSRPSSDKPRSPALAAVLAADADLRPRALQDFVEEQISTNAVFAGQYSGLMPVQPEAVALLSTWITEPPRGVSAAPAFRIASIQALRDLVDEPADALLDELRTVADDASADPRLCTTAVYALAQFGDRERVEALIANLEKQAELDDPREQFNALAQLSDTYYNLREHEAAVEAYDRLVALIETLPPQSTFPTIYYNRVCSLALLGRLDDAFAGLQDALAEGARVGRQLSRQLLETDRDIAALRADPRFAELVAKYLDSPDK